MTREEAISVIENEIQIDVRLCTGEQVDRFQTALYMAISALRAEPTGDPLTLEQLREMDGKPVWVKVIGKTGISCDGWCEVEIRDKDPFAYVLWPGSEVEDIAKIEDYGKTWSCYAYPPARIDREAWVSVEDRMPEDENDGETVLVIVFGKPHENITLHGVIMTAGYFRDEGWVLNEYPEWEGPEVTHWMPLPSPPAELEKRLRGVRA